MNQVNKRVPFLKIVVLLSFLMGGIWLYAQTESDKKQILSTLDRQTQAWNNGDLPLFMQGYWQSDSLRFIGKEGITYGWQATLKRYQTSYPGKEGMGKLDFNSLSIELLSPESAFVVGKWELLRPEKGNLSGHFTLLWRKIKGRWLIVADHSS
jgi:ketosteroid isomerase-like protein